MKNIFHDKKGNVVIGQKPNLPIIVWFATLLLELILPASKLSDVVSYISFGAIFTWAWMELFDGVTLFRKILGGLVLFVIIFNRV